MHSGSQAVPGKPLACRLCLLSGGRASVAVRSQAEPGTEKRAVFAAENASQRCPEGHELPCLLRRQGPVGCPHPPRNQALLHFSCSEIEIFGGTKANRCAWSVWIFSSMISALLTAKLLFSQQEIERPTGAICFTGAVAPHLVAAPPLCA
jgi:hypothetical protein